MNPYLVPDSLALFHVVALLLPDELALGDGDRDALRLQDELALLLVLRLADLVRVGLAGPGKR